MFCRHIFEPRTKPGTPAEQQHDRMRRPTGAAIAALLAAGIPHAHASPLSLLAGAAAPLLRAGGEQYPGSLVISRTGESRESSAWPCPGIPTCSNHGTCNSRTGACECDERYAGNACDVCSPARGGDDCNLLCPGTIGRDALLKVATGDDVKEGEGQEVVPCSGHGDCIGAGGKPSSKVEALRCQCSLGYVGAGCEYECPGVTRNGSTEIVVVCGGHGSCGVSNRTGTAACSCEPTWASEDCTVQCPGSFSRPSDDDPNQLINVPCNEHGVCLPSGLCDCFSGWSGTECSLAAISADKRVVWIVVFVVVFMLLLGAGGLTVSRYKRWARTEQHLRELRRAFNTEDMDSSLQAQFGDVYAGSSDASNWAIKMSDLTIDGHIARGASSEVYFGLFAGQSVAVKKLLVRSSHVDASELTSFFRREAGILSRLHHPNVVRFYGVAYEHKHDVGDMLYIVTELCAGSLGDLIRRPRPAAPPTWRTLLDSRGRVRSRQLHDHQAQLQQQQQQQHVHHHHTPHSVFSRRSWRTPPLSPAGAPAPSGSSSSQSPAEFPLPSSRSRGSGLGVGGSVDGGGGSEGDGSSVASGALDDGTGESLEEFMDRVILETARGVAFLHSRGVVHRDLKHDNILLDTDNNVKLCDFGVSRMVDKHTSSLLATTAVATPAFMAPEVIRKGSLSPSADVFSFGIVMHAVYAWAEPYHELVGSCSVFELMERVCAGNRPDSALIPARYRELYLECVAQEPSQRPSMEQVVERLARSSVPHSQSLSVSAAALVDQ